MNELLMPINETPLTISQFGLYPQYRKEGQRLLRELKGQTEQFVEEAFDLFNDRMMEEGNVPCPMSIIIKLHTDAVLEASGSNSIN